jgi:hypothetical protein
VYFEVNHDACILRLTRHCPAYLYEEAPFNKPCIDPLKRLEWWREVATDSGGQVLAVSPTTLDYLYATHGIAYPALDSRN